MKVLLLALSGVLLLTPALAQAPAPRSTGGPQAQDVAPPPPPPPPRGPEDGPGPRGPWGEQPPRPDDGFGPRGPRGDHPPPPRGAEVHIGKATDGGFRLDVKCAEADTTKDCADVAGQLLDRLIGAPKR